ncbi:MAG: hypothetical protein LW875_08620, partial [Proteobacteria bacterium]|nr:hypothetical protein [Pseudomonadota bacterium]
MDGPYSVFKEQCCWFYFISGTLLVQAWGFLTTRACTASKFIERNGPFSVRELGLESLRFDFIKRAKVNAIDLSRHSHGGVFGLHFFNQSQIPMKPGRYRSNQRLKAFQGGLEDEPGFSRRYCEAILLNRAPKNCGPDRESARSGPTSAVTFVVTLFARKGRFLGHPLTGA